MNDKFFGWQVHKDNGENLSFCLGKLPGRKQYCFYAIKKVKGKVDEIIPIMWGKSERQVELLIHGLEQLYKFNGGF